MEVMLLVKCGEEGTVTHAGSSFSPQDSVVLHGCHSRCAGLERNQGLLASPLYCFLLSTFSPHSACLNGTRLTNKMVPYS